MSQNYQRIPGLYAQEYHLDLTRARKDMHALGRRGPTQPVTPNEHPAHDPIRSLLEHASCRQWKRRGKEDVSMKPRKVSPPENRDGPSRPLRLCVKNGCKLTPLQ
jgi:hypothetical protein